MKGGAMGNTYKFNFTQAVRFQMGIMESQMALENVFTDFAKNENVPSVILCDRGLLDGSAYVDKDVWQAVLDESGWSTAQLRDKRYDSIIHLVTAAEGAEQFYSYGNKTRYEDIQQAIDVDKRLRNAYLGHHKFFIVDNNYVDFRAKVDRCVHLSLKSIGLPIPNEHFKKYLVQIQDPENHDTLFIPKNIQVERINIQEALLQVPDSYDNKENLEIYIRKRGSHGQFTYNHEIRYVQNNERIQKKSILSAREYVELLATLKPQTKIIEKVRSCFVYENQTFIVDTLLNVDGKPTFLRIEEGDQQIKLPPFLSIVKDVTNQEEFSTKELALHNFKMPNLDKGQKDRVK